MPTLLDLAGLDVPAAVHGRSFRSALTGEGDAGHDLVVSTWPLYNLGETTRAVDSFERTIREPLPSTITTARWQMLYTIEGIPVELYDLAADPMQETDIASGEPSVVADLHARFVELLERTGTDERLIAPRRRV